VIKMPVDGKAALVKIILDSLRLWLFEHSIGREHDLLLVGLGMISKNARASLRKYGRQRSS
jgi:hypothetical protein